MQEQIDAEDSLVLIKSHDSVDKIVRFVYNIIEKRYFFLRTMIIDSLKRGMVICLLRQLN